MKLRSSNLANGRVQPMGEKFPLKGAWSGSHDSFQNFKPPFIISGIDEAILK